MSLTDSHVLADIYHGLAAPSCSYIQPLLAPRPRRNAFPIYSSPRLLPSSPLKPAPTSLPINSLIPNQLPLLPAPVAYPLPTPQTVHLNGAFDSEHTDSLTRERKGKMPALAHLLSVEQGKVLSLAADERHVYAGCQSEDNEITVGQKSVKECLASS